MNRPLHVMPESKICKGGNHHHRGFLMSGIYKGMKLSLTDVTLISNNVGGPEGPEVSPFSWAILDKFSKRALEYLDTFKRHVRRKF